jgi:hypothetical protein
MHVPQLGVKVTGSVRYRSNYLRVVTCHMNAVGRLNCKIGERFFKLAIGNKSPHENTNDNGVRVVNLATLPC